VSLATAQVRPAPHTTPSPSPGQPSAHTGSPPALLHSVVFTPTSHPHQSTPTHPQTQTFQQAFRVSMAAAVTSLGGPPIGPDNVAILSVTDAAGGRRRRRLHADRTRTTSTAGGEEEEPAHGDAEGGEGTMARAALYGAAEGGEGTVVARAALTALAIRILATVRSAPTSAST